MKKDELIKITRSLRFFSSDESDGDADSSPSDQQINEV